MIERYTRPEMSKIWSEEHRMRLMLRVEEAFLKALAADKDIPASEMKVLAEVMTKNLVAQAREKEKRSGHDVIAMLQAVADELGERCPNLNRYLHYGLTSSDVLDTAFALQLREACELLLNGWREAAEKLRALSRKHELTWMVGRTHGVHAEPLTFGVKVAGWHAEALRNIERLKRARELASFGKTSGAVGAFTQLGPELEAEALEALGLKPEPVATQVVPRDRHAEYFHALVLSAVAVERWSVEIRHLQRTEVLELEEPFHEGQKGSSAMPHKRNPILCENLSGLARLIRSQESAIVENCVLWHERDISHSSVERVIFPDAHITLDFMLARLRAVLEGLVVNAGRMKENLDRSNGLVFSQRVLLRLIDAGLGRLTAYDLVQKAAMKTWKTGEHFQKTLGSDAVVAKKLSKKDLAACFELDGYKRSVRELLKRGGVL